MFKIFDTKELSKTNDNKTRPYIIIQPPDNFIKSLIYYIKEKDEVVKLIDCINKVFYYNGINVPYDKLIIVDTLERLKKLMLNLTYKYPYGQYEYFLLNISMIPLDAENIKSALDLIVIDENNDSYYTLPTRIIFLEYYSKDKQFNDVLYGSKLNYVEGSNYLIDTSHKALELYDSVSDILGDIHQLETGYKIPKNTYMKLLRGNNEDK